MYDPVVARSCDPDVAPVGAVTTLTRGTIEILVPFNRAISSVEVHPTEGKPTVFSVARQIKSARPADVVVPRGRAVP